MQIEPQNRDEGIDFITHITPVTPIKVGNLTYVTSFIKIYKDTPYCGRENEYYFSKFTELADTGIQLCVYTDDCGIDLLRQLPHPNIRIMGIVKLEELRVYKDYQRVCKETKETGGDGGSGGDESGLRSRDEFLPTHRNNDKDIAEYMCVINSKIDFVKDTMDKNPYQSSHFAWIDFSITYVFNNLASCQRLLQFYNTVELEETFLCITGCLGKTPIEDINSYINRVNWRFCGGFFIGDKASLNEFYNLNTNYFYEFLSKYKKLVWEVNFWAWIEITYPNWKPIWTKADHNDTVIDIPAILYSTNLKKKCLPVPSYFSPFPQGEDYYRMINYDYPVLDGYYASSASHYCLKVGETKKHFLNTRYVNYRIIHDGWYQYSNSNKRIISRNMFCMLDEKTFLPLFFCEVDEKEMGIVSKEHSWSVGVEDIRLFTNWVEGGGGTEVEKGVGKVVNDVEGATVTNGTNTNTLDFIATSINYSNRDYNRMILGKYTINENEKHVSLTDCKVLDSPLENPELKNIVCEKNWIPIENEKYIYKWSPFEIIQYSEVIIKDDNNNNINTPNTPQNDKHNGVLTAVTCPTLCSIARKFRGSTVFVDGGVEDELLGIVHFTEGEGHEKCYFHSLVAINKATMKPKRYSQPFYFVKKGIEYCIGFYIENNKYYYWISQMDREPLLIVTDPPNLVWMPF